MRALARAYAATTRVPQPRRHGAARLRPRRVQIFRLSAAGPDRRLARARSIRRSRRSPTAGTRRWASPCAIPTSTRRSSRAATPAGQTRPTPLLLQYGAGDYNCLHQDLYGEHVFPLQVAVLLSRPARTSPAASSCSPSSARACSRAPRSCRCARARRVIFPVHHRPVQGTRGIYRVNMRHGVSRLRSGHRHTLGIIFHDASDCCSRRPSRPSACAKPISYAGRHPRLLGPRNGASGLINKRRSGSVSLSALICIAAARLGSKRQSVRPPPAPRRRNRSRRSLRLAQASSAALRRNTSGPAR